MADTDEKKKPIENVEPKEGNPRPFPDPARRKKDAHKTRVYALLVGINDYQGDINQLNGCVRDVNNVANYLRENYGDPERANTPPVAANESKDITEVHQRLFLRILTNAKATYKNVIDAFEAHFIAGEMDGNGLHTPTGDDTFWFHFSGHGSEQFTASEMLNQVPNGKDQTMVCYNPNGVTGGIFLADKELAILVDRINTEVRTKTKRPHIVITLDACHAGSGTRDAIIEPGVATRHYNFLPAKTRDDDGVSTEHTRTLESYYKGWYVETGRSSLSIPESSHLLMAACKNLEKAGDLGLTEGGVFTSSLIEVLNEFGEEDKPYVELFERVRSRARSKRKAQHAQFEPIGSFNPYTSFLDGYRVEDKGKRYQLVPRGNNWHIDCGVLHGLPTKIDLPEAERQAGAEAPKTMIEVFLGDQSLGFATVEKVGLQDSRINIDSLDEGVVLETKIVDQSDGTPEAAHPYYGVIFSMPAPAEYVLVNGEQSLVKEVLDNWDQTEDDQDVQLSNLNIIAVSDPAEGGKAPVLEIIADRNRRGSRGGGRKAVSKLAFRSLDTGLEWTSVSDDQVREFLPVAKENIEKIINWHRFYALDNPKSKLRNEFELVFKETDRVSWSSEENGSPDPASFDFIDIMRSHTDHKVVVERSRDSFFPRMTDGEELSTLPYHVFLKHKARGPELFFYLYEFETDGGIQLLNTNGTHLEAAEAGLTHSRQLDRETPLLSSLRTIVMRQDQEKEHLWYKLLVTKQALKNPDQFNQLPFSNTKDTEGFFSIQNTTNINDWCSFNMKVTIMRKEE